MSFFCVNLEKNETKSEIITTVQLSSHPQLSSFCFAEMVPYLVLAQELVIMEFLISFQCWETSV